MVRPHCMRMESIGNLVMRVTYSEVSVKVIRMTADLLL